MRKRETQKYIDNKCQSYFFLLNMEKPVGTKRGIWYHHVSGGLVIFFPRKNDFAEYKIII